MTNYKWEILKPPTRTIERPLKFKFPNEMVFLDSGHQIWYFTQEPHERKPSLKFGYSLFENK